MVKSENPFFRNMNIGTFNEENKQKNLFSNKLVEKFMTTNEIVCY